METYFVYVTAPHMACAKGLAHTLLREKLIACANILPQATSIYVWKDELVEDEECVCVFKTTAACLPRLKERICALHPYEVPCIVALPVADGHADFLRWVAAQTSQTSN